MFMDMFYYLLICAVNPSVCLQWGGSGWWGEGQIILFDVLVEGGNLS